MDQSQEPRKTPGGASVPASLPRYGVPPRMRGGEVRVAPQLSLYQPPSASFESIAFAQPSPLRLPAPPPPPPPSPPPDRAQTPGSLSTAAQSPGPTPGPPARPSE